MTHTIRLHKALTVLCIGRLLDELTTQYGLAHGFYEGNPYLNTGLGFPLLILLFITYDHFYPDSPFYNSLLYSIAITIWTASASNLWILSGHQPLPILGATLALFVGSFVFLFFKDRFIKSDP